MADELSLQWVASGQPDALRVEWRNEPPEPIRDGGFHLVDESYNSLTWEARWLDWPAKLVKYGTFGVGAMFGGMESIWRVTARFDADGHTRTRVTMIGKASDETRAGLAQIASGEGALT